MKFQDLFLPRWQHSNPEVRTKAIGKIKDPGLLRQISEKDQSERVRKAAVSRLTEIEK